MEDFRQFSKKEGKGANDKSMYDLVRDFATKYDGKSTNELLMAIYREAERGKRAGTLTNAEIDTFRATIAPFLDDNKRKYLDKIVDELKKI